ncbi:MAG: DUF1499 domain-containing protein [Anaerolineae bacterium]|nr:DUF1499 domain-containing protein [Anaerolineae bacterium]
MVWWKVLLIVLAGVVALYVLARVLVVVLSPRPVGLGVTNGRLAPCPESPNCVSTWAQDEIHRMEPAPFATPAAQAHAKLLEIIHALPRTRIVTDTPTYVYAEFRTPTFYFIDDVEFVIDEEAGVIHFRSASRLGYSDLGLNRRRLEEISNQLRE